MNAGHLDTQGLRQFLRTLIVVSADQGIRDEYGRRNPVALDHRQQSAFGITQQFILAGQLAVAQQK
ncbi:hypothetical protein D3C72_2417320 [compost metagenome]